MNDDRSNENWEPLITGPGAQPYVDAIASIVGDLDEFAAPAFDWARALIRAYQFQHLRDPDHRQATKRELSRLADEIAHGASGASLYDGIAGVAWVFAHTSRILNDQDDTIFEELDEHLLGSLSRQQLSAYDLIGGLVGLGVYFLERLPSDPAGHGLSTVLDRLGERAERTDRSIKWHTAPQLLPLWQREHAPTGYYNLGVAHGIPGVLGLLTEVSRGGHEHHLCAEIRSVADWILCQRTSDGRLPGWIAGDVAVPRERLAWCYGELGACVTVMAAAFAIGDETLLQSALDWALRCADRRDTARVVDGGLCHGAFGNGHLFNRLFQATRRTAFKEAAVFWFNYGMELRKPGRPLGGFEAWTSAGQQTGAAGWYADSSFLTGAAGICLAMMSATMPQEPNWDITLLCRLPVARRVNPGA